jgi:hypothetical protein
MAAIGRNDPCFCGSGKKYKRCCLLKAQRISWKSRIAIALIALVFLIGGVVAIRSLGDIGQGCPLGTVWSADHRHCH